ncbi:MAG TPA: FtsX-like permease family protein, partial [Longimicrobiaceae bacterium]
MRTPAPFPPENARDALLRDARHAARSLRRAPGFAATTLLTLVAGVAVAAPALGVALAGWARPAPDDVPPALDPAAGGRLAWTAGARTAARATHEGMDSLLAILVGLVAVTLGIACVNLAILLLSRAAARRHEMAMRAALGAGRWRLARQLLAEGGLLGGAGAAAGAVLGVAGALALRAGWPEGVALFPGGPVHLPALGIAAGALAGAVLLFGLAPAVAATRRGLGGVLTVGGRGTGGPLEAKLRNGLRVLAVGCSPVLLVGTGLLARGSAPAAERADAGIDPRDTLTMRVDLPGAPEDAAGRAALLGRILRGVEAVPGAR